LQLLSDACNRKKAAVEVAKGIDFSTAEFRNAGRDPAD
jgi:hypothetical protein